MKVLNMVEKQFDKSCFDETRRKIALPVRKKKKTIGLMKDEAGGKISTKLAGVISKTYVYKKQKDDYEIELEFKKAKRVKMLASKEVTFMIMINVFTIF